MRGRAIVCGIDHSRSSLAAATLAAALAERLGSALLLLHAARAVVPVHAELLPSTLAATRERGARTLRRAVEDVDHGRAVAVLVRGAPAPRLVAAAAAVDAAFIVVGSRALGPLGRALLGSVSSHVVRRAPCPVVVVPHAAAAKAEELATLQLEGGSSRVLYAVEGNDDAACAEVVAELATRLGMQLTLAHEHRAALVVVESRRRRPLHAAFPGSTAMQLLRRCDVPVVVCRSD